MPWPWQPPCSPSAHALFFTIAAVLIGFRLGVGPAVFVVAIGVPIADYYFVPPYADFSRFDKEDLILCIGFPLVTLMFLCMIEWLRRTQHEARLLGEVANSRLEMLLRAEKRRKHAETSHSISNRVLQQFTDPKGDLLYVGRVGSRYEYISALLENELTPLAGKSGSARLLQALRGDHAATLHAALQAPLAQGARSWSMRLPRKDPGQADLVCQLEQLSTEHGTYVIVKVAPESST
jgi:K+-sensing histidine kinase KdpD